MNCPRCQKPSITDKLAGNCPSCLLEAAILDDSPLSNVEELPEFTDYEVIAEIGRGGASVVYRARDRKLKRIVALKVLNRSIGSSLDAVERFRIEASAVARLDHPNIAPLYQAGREGGLHFLALRYFEGGSLADALERNRFTLKDSARLLITAARAVHFAHQRGVLHRDLKPSNLLLDEHPAPHIADFGLAKLFDSDSSLTMSSSVLGTPNYMAPEQADGRAKHATVAADIYSLGAILFELITGRPPFSGETPLAVLRQVAYHDPPRPRSLNKAIDRDLEAICLCCLDKEPARRFATAAALADDLERWLRHEPVTVQPLSAVRRILRSIQRRPVVASLVLTVLALLVGGIAAVLWQWSRAEREREATARENYSASMTLAGERISEGDIFEARALLAKQPSRFRGWEWGYLMKEAHPELVELRLSSSSSDTTLRVPVPWHKLSPDGTKLVYWGNELPKRVIDTRDSSVLLEIGSMKEATGGAVFTSDSQFLVSGGPGPGFTLWDTAQWRKAWQFGSTTTSDRRLAMLPGSSLLVTATPTNFARLWDIKSKKLIREYAKPEDYVRIGYSQDGSRVWFMPDSPAASGDLSILDSKTGQVIDTVRQDSFVRCTIVDGRWYVTTDFNNVAAIWRTGERAPRFRTPPYRKVHWVGFSPEKERMAVLSDPGTVDFWDVTKGVRVATSLTRVTAVIWSDSEFLFTVAGDRFVRVWNWEGKELGKVPSGYAAGVSSSDVTENGRFFSISSEAPTGISPLQMWRMPPLNLRVQSPPLAMTGALAPDGSRLAVGHSSGAVTVWDTGTGEREILLHGHFRPVLSVAWSPDGKRLFSGSADRSIRVWNLEKSAEEAVITNHSAAILRLAVSANGGTLASADIGGWLRVFDTATLRELSSWRPITNLYLWSIALSPDGKTVAAGEALRQQGVWNTATGEKASNLPLLDERNGRNSVISVAFSPDGGELAACDYFGNLQFWDTKDWQLLRHAKTRGAAPSMTYTPDGSRLLVGVSDSPNADIGVSTIEVHDGHTGQHITSLAPAKGHSGTLSFAGGKLARSLIDSAGREASVAILNAMRLSAFSKERLLLTPAAQVARRGAWENAKTAGHPRSPESDSVWSEPRSNWRTRDTNAPVTSIDLTAAYNAHLETGWEPFIHVWEIDSDLRELPQGIVELKGVIWDIRGLVSLAGKPQNSLELWTVPREVRGIAVGQKCEHLHFLHAFGANTAPPGVIAQYLLHYRDGTTAELPVVAGVHIGNWWGTTWSHSATAQIAWQGDTPRAVRDGSRVRLFHCVFDNPYPAKEIAYFDFVATNEQVAPFLVGLTLD